MVALLKSCPAQRPQPAYRRQAAGCCNRDYCNLLLFSPKSDKVLCKGEEMAMRRVSLLIAAILILASGLQAQESYPRVEVFGGYSYGNIDGTGLIGREVAHGWAASISRNLHKNFGFTADFAGQYGTANDALIIVSPPGFGCIAVFPPPPGCSARVDIDFNTQQFLFGPRFTFRRERVTAFAHALFGVNRTHLTGFVANQNTFPSVSETDFAMGYGGGLDINAGKNIAIRLFQVDYVPVRTGLFGIPWRHNLRVQAGVVFKFGGR